MCHLKNPGTLKLKVEQTKLVRVPGRFFLELSFVGHSYPNINTRMNWFEMHLKL